MAPDVCFRKLTYRLLASSSAEDESRASCVLGNASSLISEVLVDLRVAYSFKTVMKQNAMVGESDQGKVLTF